jgi:chromosome partitioning protein
MIPVTPLANEKPSALATDISERLNAAIREHLLSAFAPDSTKTLRSFSAPEAAELLGVSGQFMRKLHSEGTIPEPGDVRGGRRFYTAQEVWDAREILEKSSRKKGRYLPRRSGDENCKSGS